MILEPIATFFNTRRGMSKQVLSIYKTFRPFNVTTSSLEEFVVNNLMQPVQNLSLSAETIHFLKPLAIVVTKRPRIPTPKRVV
jgi:hypothetical protein